MTIGQYCELKTILRSSKFLKNLKPSGHNYTEMLDAISEKILQKYGQKYQMNKFDAKDLAIYFSPYINRSL